MNKILLGFNMGVFPLPRKNEKLKKNYSIRNVRLIIKTAHFHIKDFLVFAK